MNPAGVRHHVFSLVYPAKEMEIDPEGTEEVDERPRQARQERQYLVGGLLRITLPAPVSRCTNGADGQEVFSRPQRASLRRGCTLRHTSTTIHPCHAMPMPTPTGANGGDAMRGPTVTRVPSPR